MDKSKHTKSKKGIAVAKKLPFPNPKWSKIILDFKGIGDTIPSFESYRDELKVPKIENWRG